MKLTLGYTAVLISAATFAADYKYGFEATKTLTTVAVILYFLLNGAFTYWIWGVEKGVVFSGSVKSGGGKKFSIASRTDKFTPIYKLGVWVEGEGEKQVEAEFMRWFTEDGVFEAKPFQSWLAGSVPVIGEADPKNAGASAGETQQTGSVETRNVRPEGIKDVLEDIQRDAVKAKSKASKRRG